MLFVAEKRAAIDAVVGRLDRVGLDDLVLDLHEGRTATAVARELVDGLDRLARPSGRDASAPPPERRRSGHRARRAGAPRPTGSPPTWPSLHERARALG